MPNNAYPNNPCHKMQIMLSPLATVQLAVIDIEKVRVGPAIVKRDCKVVEVVVLEEPEEV